MRHSEPQMRAILYRETATAVDDLERSLGLSRWSKGMYFLRIATAIMQHLRKVGIACARPIRPPSRPWRCCAAVGAGIAHSCRLFDISAILLGAGQIFR
jgi:hypothetical protein